MGILKRVSLLITIHKLLLTTLRHLLSYMQLITNLMVRLQNTELKCKTSTRSWEAYEPELQVPKIPQAGSDVRKERPKKLSLTFFLHSYFC